MTVEVLDVVAARAVPAVSNLTKGVQTSWATAPIRERLSVLSLTRRMLAERTPMLCAAISPELARTPADTRVAEILPLLAACRFLEQEAEAILRVRRLGSRGRPFWLTGVSSEVHRVPLGRVLVIAPGNYPLFLPAVQTLQALAAGNAVVWKPGRGGKAVADLFAEVLQRAGLPSGLLRVTGESVADAETALAAGADKVFFTGSAESGRRVMRQLAETLTPCVMELSGCDAVVILPSADLGRAVQALAFGMRLNGSATCMAPRRVLMVAASEARRGEFMTNLQDALTAIGPVAVPDAVGRQVTHLLADATDAGAMVHGDTGKVGMRPVLVTGVTPEMRIAQADVFAPVLSVIDVNDEAALLEAQQLCPFALTVSIFGSEAEARPLAEKMTAGSVLINDVIVPTADPRVPFGGRRGSGFGVTRGREGLLEMTAVKVVAVRRNRSSRHYEATTAAHEGLFDGLIAAAHASTWAQRLRGLGKVAEAGRRLGKKG